MAIENALHDTFQMITTLQQMKEPFTFILDTVFQETNVSDAEHVQIDIEKNDRHLAPFVNPLAEGHVISRDVYQTDTIKPAYLKPKMPSSAADLLQRAAGENPYSAMTVEERAAQMMVKDLAEMRRRITRRMEWMAAQQLTTGLVPVVGDGVSVTIDIRYNANNVFANTDLIANGWDQAGTLPLDDLDDVRLRVAHGS